jgi:hypothetical protein
MYRNQRTRSIGTFANPIKTKKDSMTPIQAHITSILSDR